LLHDIPAQCQNVHSIRNSSALLSFFLVVKRTHVHKYHICTCCIHYVIVLWGRSTQVFNSCRVYTLPVIGSSCGKDDSSISPLGLVSLLPVNTRTHTYNAHTFVSHRGIVYKRYRIHIRRSAFAERPRNVLR